MNRGVQLNEFHSVADWDMVMSSKSITPPKPKTNLVKITGGDGVIDLSTILTNGDVKYENRTIEINLVRFTTTGSFAEFLSTFLDMYHGQIVKVTFDDDVDYYYKGRATITYKNINNRVLEIKMKIDAEPYKYKQVVSIQRNDISGTTPVTYLNKRKWVVPVFKSTGEVQLQFKGNTFTIAEGEYTIPDIQFIEGDNVIIYTGNATVTVTYQEGGL